MSNVLQRLEQLEADVARLKKRTTVGGGGVPPSRHGASHAPGGTDPIDFLLTVLTADPASPDDNDAWVKLVGEELTLEVRLNGTTHTIPLYTFPS